jgi:copper oxidase (laccase) domain-containing protein
VPAAAATSTRTHCGPTSPGCRSARPLRAAFGADVVTAGRADLPLAAERALRASGIERVDRLGACTSCDDRFFSHRRDAGVTGRQGVLGLLG